MQELNGSTGHIEIEQPFNSFFDIYLTLLRNRFQVCCTNDNLYKKMIYELSKAYLFIVLFSKLETTLSKFLCFRLPLVSYFTS